MYGALGLLWSRAEVSAQCILSKAEQARLGNSSQTRYGPGIDEPVYMIEVIPDSIGGSNAVYYYHYDALGSVVALNDAGGDTVQTYEYSVYGQVAALDPNHTNPYMFTGRRFDIEIGLYYYRAR